MYSQSHRCARVGGVPGSSLRPYPAVFGNQHVYRSFAPLCSELGALRRQCVLEGEIVCLDTSTGNRGSFDDLMRRCGDAVFAVLDVLEVDART
jgi:hypothetical protein